MHVDTWSLTGHRKDGKALWTSYGLSQAEAAAEARLMLTTGLMKHVEVRHTTKATSRSKWITKMEIWT